MKMRLNNALKSLLTNFRKVFFLNVKDFWK